MAPSRWIGEPRWARKVLEVCTVLIGMLGTGTVWAVLQNAELEALLHGAQEQARLYADSTALLRALCVVPDRTGHPDAALLLRAAAQESVPPAVLFGIAAAESGYSGRNDVFGRSGEVGRLQVSPRHWAGTSPACDNLTDPENNARCGAQVVRWCFQRTGNWVLAVRCYNQPKLGLRSRRYLADVERQLGRMVLRSLDP